jgi:hypothetical protein
MSRIVNNKVAYGKTQGLIDIFNPPIVSDGARVPNGNDKGSIGQLWTNSTTNQVWMLTSYALGLAVWTPLDSAALPGILTWVTSNASPLALAINHGYVSTYAGAGNTVTTLPAVAPVGSEIIVATAAALNTTTGHSLVITAAAGDVITGNAAAETSTAGGTATLSANAPGAFHTIHLVCIVADTQWRILSTSRQPNFA